MSYGKGSNFAKTHYFYKILKYDKNLEVAIKSGNSKNISKIPLLTQDGQKIPYSKLLKSQEFGGGTAGSGGGASSTSVTTT